MNRARHKRNRRSGMVRSTLMVMLNHIISRTTMQLDAMHTGLGWAGEGRMAANANCDYMQFYHKKTPIRFFFNFATFQIMFEAGFLLALLVSPVLSGQLPAIFSRGTSSKRMANQPNIGNRTLSVARCAYILARQKTFSWRTDIYVYSDL